MNMQPRFAGCLTKLALFPNIAKNFRPFGSTMRPLRSKPIAIAAAQGVRITVVVIHGG